MVCHVLGLLSVDCHQDCAPLRIVVVGFHFLRGQWIHLILVLLLIRRLETELFYISYLSISLEHLLRNLWMIHDQLLVSHLLNSIISVALHGVVVLVDLYSESATRGEVVRLGKMTQTMMLKNIEIFDAES